MQNTVMVLLLAALLCTRSQDAGFRTIDLKLERTINLGRKLEPYFAVSNDRIALAGGRHIRVIDMSGRKLFSLELSYSQQAEGEIEFDPKGSLWVGNERGDTRITADGTSWQQPGVRDGVFYGSVSRYAGPNRRWIAYGNGRSLATADENGGKRKVVCPAPKTPHMIESFDSANDGSAAVLTYKGAAGHQLDIYSSDGKRRHSFKLPRQFTEMLLRDLSYDGERVLIPRDDGCYCFSADGKPLWRFMGIMSALDPKQSHISWLQKQAKLVDGEGMLAIKDVGGTLTDQIEQRKEYKISFYKLPPVE